jgi:hypothetical protein
VRQNDNSANSTVRARETERDVEGTLSVGRVLVKANKALGLAHDCEEFELSADELEDDDNLRAVEEVIQAWVRFAERIRTRRQEA